MPDQERNGEGSNREDIGREHSFDELAKGLASGSVSRRQALRLFGSVLLGGALASIPGVAWAKKVKTKCNKSSQCSSGQSCCSGTCTNTQTDVNNCGSCGNACASGESCCSGTCTTLDTTSNCGSCGNACTAPANGSATCSGGSCVITCDSGYFKCGDKCVDTSTDVNNCGCCGTTCTGGTCQQGYCTCPTGTRFCCGSDNTCLGGKCVPDVTCGSDQYFSQNTCQCETLQSEDCIPDTKGCGFSPTGRTDCGICTEKVGGGTYCACGENDGTSPDCSSCPSGTVCVYYEPHLIASVFNSDTCSRPSGNQARVANCVSPCGPLTCP